MLSGIVLCCCLACQPGETNLLTGQNERFNLSPDEEIAIGDSVLPLVIARYRGLSSNSRATSILNATGNRVVKSTILDDHSLHFRFYLLAEDEEIDGIVVPGGHICITEGLFNLLSTEDQLAAILGHLICHAGADHMRRIMGEWPEMKKLLPRIRSGENLNDGNNSTLKSFAEKLVKHHFVFKDETQADTITVRLLDESGYHPDALREALQLLREDSGFDGPPGFLKMHNGPADRFEIIDAAAVSAR